jgi:AcrR family transcriptional regulator
VGLRVLAETGIEAVRVEPLAKRLSVTKGSFYWHFRDREDLLVALLDAWRQKATQAVIDLVDSLSDEPEQRIRELLGLVARTPDDRDMWVEIGFRDWARRDRRAQLAVASVDRERIGYFRRLLLELGFSEDDAEARAFLIYSYILGEGVVSHTVTRLGRADRAERCVRQLLSDLPKAPAAVSR